MTTLRCIQKCRKRRLIVGKDDQDMRLIQKGTLSQLSQAFTQLLKHY